MANLDAFRWEQENLLARVCDNGRLDTSSGGSTIAGCTGIRKGADKNYVEPQTFSMNVQIFAWRPMVDCGKLIDQWYCCGVKYFKDHRKIFRRGSRQETRWKSTWNWQCGAVSTSCVMILLLHASTPRDDSTQNVLLSSCFPEPCNMPSFKSKINKLDLMSLPSYSFVFFFLPLLRLCKGHHGLSPTQLTKKKNC